MPKRNIGGCPSDADDMLAISKMKAFFWQCSRLGPHQLELDVAWEGGETYGFWFFGEKRALGLPNPLVLPARLPSEEQIDIVRALCNFEETPPRWHLDATVQHPESVFIGNERYTVLLLRRLIGIPYAATYEEVMHAQGFESEVMGKYGYGLERSTEFIQCPPADVDQAVDTLAQNEDQAQARDLEELAASTETLTISD